MIHFNTKKVIRTGLIVLILTCSLYIMYWGFLEIWIPRKLHKRFIREGVWVVTDSWRIKTRIAWTCFLVGGLAGVWLSIINKSTPDFNPMRRLQPSKFLSKDDDHEAQIRKIVDRMKEERIKDNLDRPSNPK